MKNKYIFLCIFLVFGQSLNAQFKLNTNPENPNRMPNWRTETGVVLSKNSPQITIGGANNTKSTNFLLAGVLVIVDKETYLAKWIAICGNTVITTSWKPEGKIISFISQESYEMACEDMLDRLNTIQKGVNELLDRPNYSLAELKIMFEKTLKDKFPNKREDPTFRTGGKIFVPLGCALVGGLIGGYGFPKENEIATQTITPGTKVQTGDGTFIYGPQKMKTEIHTEKNFNWTGAVIGFGSGIILGYLLNEVIF